MKRFLLTIASTLDALVSQRVLREEGHYSSFVSIGRRRDEDDEIQTTVALEIEAESDAQVREILSKRGVSIRQIKELPDVREEPGAPPSR